MNDQEKKKSSGMAEVQGDSGLDQVVGNMSSPAPEVVNSDRPRLGKEDSTDKYGRRFDPEMHLSNPDGTPKINRKTGKLCLKPGPEKKTKIGEKIEDRGEDQGKTAQVQAVETRLAAEASVDTLAQVGVMCFGDEWQFQKTDTYDERENLVLVTDRYYQVKGVRDIPPGVALTLALTGYAFRRLQFPNTRSRFEMIVLWIKSKFAGMFKIFRNGRGKNAAHVDSRANGIRENNAGRKAGGEVPEEARPGSGS